MAWGLLLYMRAHLGRGDGNAYVGGQLNLGKIAPRLPMSTAPGGWGNSVNNGCGDGGGLSKPSGDIGPGSGDGYIDPLRQPVPEPPAGADQEYYACRSKCFDMYGGRNGVYNYEKLRACIWACEDALRERAGGSSGGGTGSGGNSGNGSGDSSGSSDIPDCGMKSGSCQRDCADSAKLNNPMGWAKCATTTCAQCVEPARHLYTGCSFKMPPNVHLCLACHVYSGWNPCICAWADCIQDCIGKESGVDSLKGCVEKLRGLPDSMKCDPKVGLKVRTGDDGLPFAQIEIGLDNDLLKCLEQLDKKIKTWYEAFKSGDFSKLQIGAGKCINCCIDWGIWCAGVAAGGTCVVDDVPKEQHETWGEPGDCVLPWP